MGASLHGRRVPVLYENVPPSSGHSYHRLILRFLRKLLGEGEPVAGAWENCSTSCPWRPFQVVLPRAISSDRTVSPFFWPKTTTTAAHEDGDDRPPESLFSCGLPGSDPTAVPVHPIQPKV